MPKSPEPARMVADVLRDWRQMAGSDDTVRRVNACITARCVARTNMPADECVRYAELIVQCAAARSAEDTHQCARWLLRRAFGSVNGPLHLRWVFDQWSEIDAVATEAARIALGEVAWTE